MLYADQDRRAATDDLPGRLAQGRHQSESSPGHSGDAVPTASTSGNFRWRRLALGRTAFPESRRRSGSLRSPTQNNNNNITGFKNPRVDQLCERLRQDVRREGPRSAPCAKSTESSPTPINTHLLWYAPSIRIAYWNKFGMPPGYLPRTGDDYTALPVVVDRSRQGCRSCSRRCAIHPRSCEVGPTDDHYWDRVRQDSITFAAMIRPSSDVRPKRSMTGYFIRRFLLIIPTFIGITMAVFRDHEFRAGRPGRTPDHALQDGRGAEGGGGRRCAAASKFPQKPSRR